MNTKATFTSPTHLFSRLIPVALMLLLSACATIKGLGENGQQRIDIATDEITTMQPQQWLNEASTELAANDWISLFQAPQLEAVIDEVLIRNPDVNSAAARWAAANAAAVSANAPLFPEINASARASRSRDDDSSFPDPKSYNLGPSISWEADVWGRVRNSANASERERDASLADYAATRLSIAGNTAQAWFDLIESQLLLDLAKRDISNQQRALSLTERRFFAGVAASTDVRLAKSSVASAEATLASRQQNRSALARRLETIMRRYPENRLEVPADLPPLPALTGTGKPVDIFSLRPDLLAAEQRMQAAGLGVDVARKNLLPRLTLTADASLGGNSSDDWFDTNTLFSNIAAGLAGPIFNAGGLRAEVGRNRAVLEQTIEQYVDTSLTAYLEVENALDAEKRLLERAAALATALTEAQAAEERLARRYSQGLASILELLDAQRRAIAAESQLISARKERLNNRVRLHMSLGGGDLGVLPNQSN